MERGEIKDLQNALSRVGEADQPKVVLNVEGVVGGVPIPVTGDITTAILTKYKRYDVTLAVNTIIDVESDLGSKATDIFIATDKNINIRYNSATNDLIPLLAGQEVSIGNFEVSKIYLYPTVSTVISIEVKA